MKKLNYKQTPFLNEIMSAFSCEETNLEAFPDFPAAVKKITFTVSKSLFSLIFYQTEDKVKIKLFDTHTPEQYYKTVKFSKFHAVRSNDPCILDFKFKRGNREIWLNTHVPFHSEHILLVIDVVTKMQLLLYRVYSNVARIEQLN